MKKSTGRVATVYRTNLMIYRGDKYKALKVTRVTLRHLLRLDSMKK